MKHLTFHIGLQFTSHDGKLVSCYQLLNEDGRAVAIADYTDTILSRRISSELLTAADWQRFIDQCLADTAAKIAV